MRIAGAVRDVLDRGDKAFVPYITAGDPAPATTVELLAALGEAGATAVELGVPFSDPVGDGVVIQRAAERALARGVTMEGVLGMVQSARQSGVTVPIVLFSYVNPIVRMGYQHFAERAAAAGVDGVLVVDLPPEEADGHRAALRDAGVDTIFLTSPTTTDERLRLAGEASTGFVYHVARTGVTGVRAALSESLRDELTRVRAQVSAPVLVGFGISTPEQAAAAAAGADGVVVGSALVKAIAESGAGGAAGIARSMTEAMVAAIRSSAMESTR